MSGLRYRSDMSTQSLTQKWLRQNTAPYLHADRVYADVDATLARFSTLAPRSDIYTHDDGRTQLLLCVHGLLPISFRQAAYNIPVAIWISKEYPSLPPIVYVVPTSDMLVKSGNNVDVSGRINIDYIQQWERKTEGRNLSSLVDALQEQFSRESPVYAKPKTTQTLRPASLGHAAKPPPPLPSATSITPMPRAGAVAHVIDQRPSLPPKPGHGNFLITSPGHPHQTFVNQAASPAHTPPSHPVISQSLPQQQRYATPIATPQPPTVWPSGMHDGPITSIHPLQPGLPILPTTGSSQEPFVSIRQHTSESAKVPNLLDEDCVDLPQQQTIAPPPPRPANPELLRLQKEVQAKFAAEFVSLTQAMALDAERLRAQQADLLAGEPAIQDEMARLAAVKDVCLNVAGRMRIAVDNAERNMAELRRKGDPEVDELVCSTTIVHNQLIELVAEDNAIEDTIYHMHRALNAGRLDLERFLRTTRILAEEQFMKRALIEKIHGGLPIGASIGSEWNF